MGWRLSLTSTSFSPSCGHDLLRLPQVAAIVGGDNVKGGRHLHADETDEWILERRTIDVHACGFDQQCPDPVVRSTIIGKDLGATPRLPCRRRS